MVSPLPMALLRQLAGLVLLLLLVLVPLTPASGAQPYELVVVEHLRLKVPEAGLDISFG